jgi:hypothetical protein
MSAALVCPKCWSWDQGGKRSNCRQCGTPLVLSDGRTVSEAAQGKPSPLLAMAGGGTALPVARVSRSGIDWVDIAMFITIGYGLVIMAALVILSIALPNIKIPITNPNTGLTTVQTFSLGPIFAVAGVITGGFFLLFAWLTKYLIARLIFLGFDGLAVLASLAHLSAGQTITLLSAADLAIDIGYGFVLVMSLVSPRTGFKS